MWRGLGSRLEDGVAPVCRSERESWASRLAGGRGLANGPTRRSAAASACIQKASGCRPRGGWRSGRRMERAGGVVGERADGAKAGILAMCVGGRGRFSGVVLRPKSLGEVWRRQRRWGHLLHDLKHLHAHEVSGCPARMSSRARHPAHHRPHHKTRPAWFPSGTPLSSLVSPYQEFASRLSQCRNAGQGPALVARDDLERAAIVTPCMTQSHLHSMRRAYEAWEPPRERERE